MILHLARINLQRAWVLPWPLMPLISLILWIQYNIYHETIQNVLVNFDTNASSARFAETGHFVKSISVILNLSLQPVLKKFDEWSFFGNGQCNYKIVCVSAMSQKLPSSNRQRDEGTFRCLLFIVDSNSDTYLEPCFDHSTPLLSTVIKNLCQYF